MNFNRLLCLLLIFASLQTLSFAQVTGDHSKNMKEGLVLFKNKVKGLFVDHCLRCHGGEKIKGKFDMSTRAKLLKGGFEDKGFVPGNHKESFLWKVIAHEAEPFMPNKKPKMKQADIDAIAKWIDLGAPYDQPLTDQKEEVKEFVITKEDRDFWSFQPIKKLTPPEINAESDIDKFVTAKLKEKGLIQSQEADKVSLIRRLYFDMVGMPPTPSEVNAFISGKTTYEQLVDKLLNDTRYGESFRSCCSTSFKYCYFWWYRVR